jgi:MYXO-CTERM domain-containing protein/prepilin-type processing-associated H-X9-DG protein
MRTYFLFALAGVSAAVSLVPSVSHAAPPPPPAPPAFGDAHDLTPPSFHGGGAPSDGVVDASPAVASDGQDFLVAWSDQGAIECARYTPNGRAVLDAPPVQLALHGTSPAVLWDGAKYLVVAGTSAQRVDPATGRADAAFALEQAVDGGRFALAGGALFEVSQDAAGAVTGTLFDANGAAVKTGIALATGAKEVGVAGHGGTAIVAWTDGHVVHAVRVSSAGDVLDASPIVVDAGAMVVGDAGAAPADTSHLSVAAGPMGYLLAWRDTRAPAHALYSTYAARIAASGAVADPGGALVAPEAWNDAPAAAWSGDAWWVVSGDNGYELDPVGPAQAPQPHAYSGARQPAAIAASPAGRLVAWADSGGIEGFPTAPNGTALHGIGAMDLAKYLSHQTLLCAAASPDGYLAVVADDYVLRTLRFDRAGNALDEAPPENAPPGTHVACGTTAGQYVVLAPQASWTLPTTGPATSTRISLGVGDAALSMSCLADRCLVAWADAPALGQVHAYAAVVDPSGNPLAPAFDVTTAILVGALPRVLTATNGSSFFVAEDGYVMTVAADGSHGSFAAIDDTQVAALAGAGGGGAFLLGGAQTNALYRFGATGASVGAPEPLPLAAANGESIGAAWDGRGFFVAQAVSGVGPAPVVGLEVSSGPYVAPGDGGAADAGGPVATPLFARPCSGVWVGSDGSGNVAALAVQSESAFGAARLSARFAVASTPDAGPGAGDAGGTADAGPLGGDAGASADAGGGRDAGPGGIDAGLAGGDGGSAPQNGEESTTQSSCACRAAGGAAPASAAGLAVSALALLALVRRRRAS